KVLDAAPIQVQPDDDASKIEKALDEMLRERYLVTLAHLAARKGAELSLVERLVKYLDQQMKDHPDDAHWRAQKYRMLIAIDRPKELEAELKQWKARPAMGKRCGGA